MRSQPQQKRSTDKVDQIIRSFRVLLVDYPFDEISTSMIAAHCRMPVSAIYRYFADKYQILQTVAEQLFADEDSRLEEIFREADSPDALRDAAVKAIDLEVEFYLRDDMTRRLILAILATPQIAETVKRSVERTMHILLEEARRFFPDMNQEDVAATVQTSVALYLGLGQNAFMQEDPMKRVRLIEEWKRAQGAYVTAIFGMSK